MPRSRSKKHSRSKSRRKYKRSKSRSRKSRSKKRSKSRSKSRRKSRRRSRGCRRLSHSACVDKTSHGLRSCRWSFAKKACQTLPAAYRHRATHFRGHRYVYSPAHHKGAVARARSRILAAARHRKVGKLDMSKYEGLFGKPQGISQAPDMIPNAPPMYYYY